MNDREPEPPASPPCLAHELDADGRHVGEADAAADVARWRRSERKRLTALRLALGAAARREAAARVGAALDGLIDSGAAPVVSLYWPIRGELDLRDWMHAAHGRGVRVVLPLVVGKARPLRFRRWTPGARMERGRWNIPVPADGEALVPDVVVAPPLGFDRACYRLGNGGGFFDRTLAALAPRPLAIGVAHSSAAIRTIYPQPHDVPMDVVVTEAGVIRREGG